MEVIISHDAREKRKMESSVTTSMRMMVVVGPRHPVEPKKRLNKRQSVPSPQPGKTINKWGTLKGGVVWR